MKTSEEICLLLKIVGKKDLINFLEPDFTFNWKLINDLFENIGKILNVILEQSLKI